MKFFKRFLLFVFIMLFLFAGAAFIIVSYYKKEITGILTDYLKVTYGLTLKVDDVDVALISSCPNISVKLDGVDLENDLFPGREKKLFKAKTVSLSFDILKLLKKEFVVRSMSVKDAQINLVQNIDGIKNFQIKKDTAVSGEGQSIKFEIDRILFKNTNFKFFNQEKKQRIDFTLAHNIMKLRHYTDGVEVDLAGDINVKELLFKSEKGAFLNNINASVNLHTSICFNRKEIFIHSPSSVDINQHHYNVASFIELNDKKQLALCVESENVNYQQGISLMNYSIKKNLENINVSNAIDVKILLIAKIGIRQDPIVIVKLRSRQNDISIGHSKIPYTNVSFEGSIISLDSSLACGNAEQAKVIFKSLKGNVYGLPFSGSVVIHNLANPHIKINANIFIDAKRVPFEPGKEFILGGTAKASLSYSGPISHMNQKEFLNEPMKLNAGITFNNISYREIGTPFTYVVDGKASVNGKELDFDHLQLKMNGGNIVLKGVVNNFIQYAMGYTNGFTARLVAVTDHFDLTSYVVKSNDSLGTHNKKEEKMEQLAHSNFEFDVKLVAKKFLIRKVEAEQASMDLHYKNKLLTIKTLTLNTCDGNLSAKGSIYNLHKIEAEIEMKNVNVTKVFDQFENFGQKAIVSENLKGNVFVNANLKMQLDDKMEVIGNTMNGEIKLKLKDGHLLNYEPLQNISNFVFRNRNFRDITFSEIDETFLIDGFKMQIREMEIASNILNLSMSGTYHFKDYSSINMFFPWNNLKRRGKDYVTQTLGQTSENSKGLKLNYSGYPNKLKLSLGNKQ